MSHRWIDDQGALDRLVESLAGAPAVALDTEFHRERTYHPQVALLQLAAPDGSIALVDTLRVDLHALRPLLLSDTTIVMHAAVQDLEVLQRVAGALPRHLFDTQLAAGFAGYNGPSLVTLVHGLLDIRLPKGDRLADWLRRPLTDEQREYAASDVAHLLEVHDLLRGRLESEGRLTWAEDECAELLRRADAPKDPDEAWWRVKEARQLRGASIGVAQELAAWRERRADAIDQPIRFVLPDLALVGMAQRPPKTADAVRRVRGLDDRHLRGNAVAEILAAVERGKALPRSALRLPPSGDVDRDLRPAVTLVSAWVSQLGRDLQIDTTLLATRSDIEALLRGDEDARLARGWRAEVVGQDIADLVKGRAALSFNGKGRLVLEHRST